MLQKLLSTTFWASAATILYTFFGYPAILAAWARLRPRPVRASRAHTPSVSLVIAAYNEEEVIAAKIANSFALDYPHELLEVIVAADGSSDRTAEVAAADPRVRVVYTPERRGKMAALNRAIAAATGEIVVCSDANNYYPPATLRAIVAPFADPEVGMATGRKQIADADGRPLDKSEGLYWRYERLIMTWESQIGSVAAAVGEIMAVRRSAFRPLESDTIVNDDFMLAMSTALAGWRVAYAPEALSLEPASATLGDEAKRRARMVSGRMWALWSVLPRLARSRPQLAWQVLSHKALRPAVPVAMVAAALSSLPLARRGGLMALAAAAQAAFYGAAALGWRQDRRGARRSKLLYLPYYFCRVNLAQLQGLAGARNVGAAVRYTRPRRAERQLVTSAAPAAQNGRGPGGLEQLA